VRGRVRLWLPGFFIFTIKAYLCQRREMSLELLLVGEGRYVCALVTWFSYFLAFNGVAAPKKLVIRVIFPSLLNSPKSVPSISCSPFVRMIFQLAR
jgi:hypothetical protein